MTEKRSPNRFKEKFLFKGRTPKYGNSANFPSLKIEGDWSALYSWILVPSSFFFFYYSIGLSTFQLIDKCLLINYFLRTQIPHDILHKDLFYFLDLFIRARSLSHSLTEKNTGRARSKIFSDRLQFYREKVFCAICAFSAWKERGG